MVWGVRFMGFRVSGSCLLVGFRIVTTISRYITVPSRMNAWFCDVGSIEPDIHGSCFSPFRQMCRV